MCIENTLNYITRLSLKNKYLIKHLIVCHCNNSQKGGGKGVGGVGMDGVKIKKTWGLIINGGVGNLHVKKL